MKVEIKSLENKAVGEIELSDDVFGIEVRADILHRMVNYQLAKRRAGTHKTKGISEVSGTGKKPFKQKGTGRARQGSLRATQFRGGATVFGPVVRSHAHDLTKKFRKLALRTALSAKARDGKLLVVDEVKADTHKTKEMAAALSALELKSALVIDGVGRTEELNENFVKATRNIPLIDVLPEIGCNVYDILNRDVLVLSKSAVEKLEGRLK